MIFLVFATAWSIFLFLPVGLVLGDSFFPPTLVLLSPSEVKSITTTFCSLVESGRAPGDVDLLDLSGSLDTGVESLFFTASCSCEVAAPEMWLGSSSDARRKPTLESGKFREASLEDVISSLAAAEDSEVLLTDKLAPIVGKYFEAGAKDGNELFLPEMLAGVEEFFPRSWEAFTNSVLGFALLDGESWFCPERDSCNCPALVQLLTSVVYINHCVYLIFSKFSVV